MWWERGFQEFGHLWTKEERQRLGILVENENVLEMRTSWDTC
jgi:hypothetical protein